MGWILRLVGMLFGRISTLSTTDKVALFAGGMSLTDTILTKIVGHDLKAEAFALVVEEVATRSGLQLDPSDPFSDASIAGALSARFGVTIRSVKDRALIEEDIEAFGLARIEAKTGYRLTTLRDVDQLKSDIANIGAAVVVERTGLPILPLPDDPSEWRDTIKDRVLTWARAELESRMAVDVQGALARIEAATNIEAMVATINERLESIGSLQENITARGIAMQVAEQLAGDAVRQFQVRVVRDDKVSRRRAQLRAAQDKFRRTHGNRQQYVPIGMEAVITETQSPP